MEKFMSLINVVSRGEKHDKYIKQTEIYMVFVYL